MTITMNENNKRIINNIEDLHKEKLLLRSKLKISEEKLRDNYDGLMEKFQPALNIVNFVAGNKLLNFNKSKNENGQENNWSDIIKKLVISGVSGSLMLSNSKSRFFKSLLSYGMDQGLKFITEEDLKSRFYSIKNWFSKRKESDVEEVEDLTNIKN